MTYVGIFEVISYHIRKVSSVKMTSEPASCDLTEMLAVTNVDPDR
jgi:hypothetical protein